MHRFVLLYHAREGSTALIEAINNRRNVNVPITEHLDAWWIERECPDVDVLHCLRQLLETGELSHGPRKNLHVLKSAWSPLTEIDGIGFKWRPFGNPRRVIDILKEYDVTVLFLHRSLLDVSSSLYLSRTLRRTQDTGGVGAGHFQFKFRKLSEEEQKRIRARLDGLEVGLNPFRFYVGMLKRLYQDARKLNYLRRAHLAGLPTAIVDYADLARDIEGVVDSVLETAGIPVRRQETNARKLTFKKASSRSAAERIRHFWLIRWNPITWLLIGFDHALADHVRRLSRRGRQACRQQTPAAPHDTPSARAERMG